MWGRKAQRIRDLERELILRPNPHRVPAKWDPLRTATGVMLQLEAQDHYYKATKAYFGIMHMQGNAIDMKVRDNMSTHRGSFNRTPEQLRDAASYQRAQARAHEKAAQELIEEAEELENGSVVQVRFPNGRGTRKTYAYRVPAGLTVNVGDLVKVTAFNVFEYQENANIVEVVGTGRQGYTGELKDIDGKVQILRVDDDA